jgi:DNA-binding transcriptional LysR family regulator
MLDTRRLRVFREVARHGSFSAAADALGYTQPAVSRQIATLEAELGTVLVRRVPQGAVLTDAGNLLLERADAILGRLDDVEAELRALAGLERGRLRFATFASAAASIVPPAVARFRTRHPGVELSIVMADPAESLPALRSGELDLALSHDPLNDVAVSGVTSARPNAGIVREVLGVELTHLFDDPMYVAMPSGHPLADAPQLDLNCFAEEPWMLATTNTCPDSRLFLRACHEAGFEPQIAFQNDDYPAILGFVAAGVGVALIPDMVTRGIREDVLVRQLDPAPPPRPIMAAIAAGYRSPAAVAMLSVLREVSREWVTNRVLVTDIGDAGALQTVVNAAQALD